MFKLKDRHLYCFATLVITEASLFNEYLNEAVVAILYSLLSPDVILDMPAAKIPKFQLSEDLISEIFVLETMHIVCLGLSWE